jgi:tetratricopeptide (TPR) repeat protein
MKKVVFTSVLALAIVPMSARLGEPAAFAQDAASQASPGGQSGSITIKDPAEYNAYSNAIGQSAPAAKAAAIEDFLTKYPNSVVKSDMLEQLMGAYQAAGDMNKTVDAANRLLQVDPNNLRALALSVFIKKQQGSQSNNQQDLDEAASLAQRGLNATKPANMQQADFDKLKQATTPIFYSAIAVAAIGKKDFKTAIEAFRNELKAVPPEQTTQGPVLNDTYLLGTAYVQEDPKDILNGIWFLSRAADYAPPAAKPQIEKAATYWYNKYHGNTDGFNTVEDAAKTNIFPPDGFTIQQAPPPPSPQELAHTAVTSTPDLKTLALGDKEFILANGSPEDQAKVWDVLKGVTAEVPGTVISATPDTIQLAVSDDAKASNKADFTVNMKTPLKTPPAQGAQIKVDATFDSYTSNPSMITLKDGEIPGAKKPAAPARRTVHRKQ